jgi:hypothetical protein
MGFPKALWSVNTSDEPQADWSTDDFTLEVDDLEADGIGVLADLSLTFNRGQTEGDWSLYSVDLVSRETVNAPGVTRLIYRKSHRPAPAWVRLAVEAWLATTEATKRIDDLAWEVE